MELIGKALARLAHEKGGQFLLELPDDLPPPFVAALLDGANKEVAAVPHYAIFVTGGRKDVEVISPRVGFRELAMYRQDERLAIAYASENRGMATYSSVYPLLLPNGFPASDPASGGTGVVGFNAFASMLAEVISTKFGRFGLSIEELNACVAGVLQFLASAYEVAGNSQASFVADWWLHVQSWLHGIGNISTEGPDAIRLIYGCAGLPAPAQGLSLAITPRDYVSVLTSRWATPASISAELSRLEGIEASSEGATTLSGLDWETSFARSSLHTDSPIARAARGDGIDPAEKMRGWAGICETEFKDSYVYARDKLRIRRHGDELVGPWQTGFPVLRVGSGEVLAPGASATIAIELILPKNDGGAPSSAPILDDDILENVSVTGARGTTASFVRHSARFDSDGLVLAGELTVEVTKRSRNLMGLQVEVTGALANSLANASSGKFTLIWPNDVVLWIKPVGKARKGAIMGPFYVEAPPQHPQPVEVGKLGTQDFAVVWGEAAANPGAELSIGSVEASTPWPGLEGASAQMQAEVVSGIHVKLDGLPVYELSVSSTSESPRSPFIAAARGVSPDAKKNPPESLLEDLERACLEVLSTLESGHALGCFVLPISQEKRDLATARPGVMYSEALASQVSQVSPGLPSEHLVSSNAYQKLLLAYKNLDIPGRLERAQAHKDDVSLIFSQLPLTAIEEELIDALLIAYRDLLVASSQFEPSDQFWARNPFSIAVVPVEYGSAPARGVLLSPLHPIRLAWAWRVQAGLREAYDDGVDPAVSLSLLDGTFFPAYCLVNDEFGEPKPFMAIRIDAHPEDLFLGWHASVAIVDNSPAIPEWIDGRRFPADGLSGLTEASVGAALDDFIRVSPHVQALKIALAASQPTARSLSIDHGILAKLREMAVNSAELDGISGVRIFDSKARLGKPPGFSSIEDAFPSARPGFNLEWSVVGPTTARCPHITFLEGNASRVSMSLSSEPGQGWLAHVPVRRTPQRWRANGYSTVGFGLREPGTKATEFARVVHRYELAGASGVYTLRVSPNMAGIANRPNWLVAGDFGVDPKTLSSVASSQGEASYVLWDWRPAAAIKGRSFGSRLQPYFVLAAVPAALNQAISDRLQLLKPGVSQMELQDRSRFLIATLAERAIGLNTLLAIGHHQATGALGFFFALRCTADWLRSAPVGEVRLLIPIDAVDPFLRDSGARSDDGSMKRADLLAVRMRVTDNEACEVVLAPIEVKHYGLSSDESEVGFPRVGEARLDEHLEQLTSYQVQLNSLCESYREAGSGAGQFIAERLVAILDAALQLNPELGGAEVLGILRSVSMRSAEVRLGRGLLMWFQAKGRTQANEAVAWDEIGGAVEAQRVELRVDPVAFDEAIWSHEPQQSPAFDCTTSALEVATSWDEDDVGGGNAAASAGKRATQPAELAEARDPKESSARAQDLVDRADATAIERPVSGSRTTSLPAKSVAKIERKRMSEEALERRYSEVLGALREFNVKVERPRGEVPYKEGPAFVEFSVAPAYGVSVSKIESQLPNVKLRLRLPADANIGCTTHMGNVVLTVPKLNEERYFVDAMELWRRAPKNTEKFSIPVAEDIGGNVVSIDFSSSNSPHVLIAGVTGSGKSEALLTILHGAAHLYGPDELRLKLIDPKQTELLSLADLPHTDGTIGSTGEEAIAMLDEAVEEMERRYAAFKAAGVGVRSIKDYQVSVGPMPRWMIVLDEYADLISDDGEKRLIEKGLQRLSQKARAAGIHVIVSTQKPIVKVIDTVVKGNLPGKIALRVNTGMESRVILDEDGAQDLTGKGDSIIKVGGGKIRAQFAMYSI